MSIYETFGVLAPFDSSRKYVTSPFFSSTVLASIRFLVAVYTLFTLLFVLVWDSVRLHDASGFFSYFTELTYIGICSYYWASFVQTAAYARRGGSLAEYPLQRWKRWLQLLHMMLGTTIVAFPILVTVVYWALLASSSTFENRFSAWSNISLHAFNTVFSLFEMVFTNSPPSNWIMLPFMIIILAGYLGVAYITHATQGFYTYSFLDPSKQHDLVAAYIVGIAVAECIVFCIAKGIMTLRQHLAVKKGKVLCPPESQHFMDMDMKSGTSPNEDSAFESKKGMEAV